MSGRTPTVLALGQSVLTPSKGEASAAPFEPTSTLQNNHKALALDLPLDDLVFDRTSAGRKERLTLLFEAVANLPVDEQRVVQAVLDGLIVKHRTKQLAELHIDN